MLDALDALFVRELFFRENGLKKFNVCNFLKRFRSISKTMKEPVEFFDCYFAFKSLLTEI